MFLALPNQRPRNNTTMTAKNKHFETIIVPETLLTKSKQENSEPNDTFFTARKPQTATRKALVFAS